MKQVSFTIVLILLARILPAQTAMPLLAGWKLQQQAGHYSYRPTIALNGNSFLYEIMPLQQQSNQTTEAWFRQVIDQDLERSGYTITATANSKISDQKGIYTYATPVTDKSGKAWYVSYVAYGIANDQRRWARLLSTPDLKYFTANARPAMEHFGKLAQQEGFTNSNNANSSTAGSTAGTSTNQTANTTSGSRPKAEDFLTDNGLKPAQIKGVVIHLEYRVGVGGAMYGSYEPYLMLADGSVYNDPFVSPYKFNAAKSKQLEPKKWGTWKEEGKTMSVTQSDGKTSKWTSNWFWTRPAVNGEKMAGSYGTISGGGNTAYGGNVMVVSAANLTFNKSGQFTMLSTGGVSNSGDYGMASSAFSNKESAGTYLLNGYAIEMRFNNGKVQQQLFFFYPDSKDYFGVGSRIYTPNDEKKK